MDKRIAPLIKELSHRGFHTLQSCSGHESAESHPSGHIWIRGADVSDEQLELLSTLRGIEQVSRMWGRELFAVAVIVFTGETTPLFGEAVGSILRVLAEPAAPTLSDEPTKAAKRLAHLRVVLKIALRENPDLWLGSADEVPRKVAAWLTERGVTYLAAARREPAVSIAQSIAGGHWLEEPRYKWFLDGHTYASTQTRAIAALSKCTPAEMYDAVWAILRGAGITDADEFFAAEPTLPEEPERPYVICLCGSTRFWRTFQIAGLEQTLEGNIVLSIGAASGTDDDHFHGLPADEYEQLKTRLDELHLRKIKMADGVLVLDVGGYIGESTQREIDHAVGLGKPVLYWSEAHPDYEEPALAGEPRFVRQEGDSDCFSACLASLTGISLSLFPQWTFGDKDPVGQWNRCLAVLKKHGWFMMNIWHSVGGYCIAHGKSPRGDWDHSVIYSNGLLYFDPHSSGDGLASEPESYTIVLRRAERRAEGEK
jgi:hypothetical protein